jgi:hypothetical protein
MATTKYIDLLTEVLPVLAADPSDPVTEAAIKRAAIEFCNGSWVWLHMPDLLDVEAGETTYDIDVPAGADVTTVVDAALDGTPLQNKSLAWLNANVPRWRKEPGTPRYFTQINTEQLMLAQLPAQTQAQALALTLALQPDQRATGMPRWIVTQYLYVIASGAIANLMLMPGQDWTDMALGAIKKAEFAAGVNDARNDALSALGRAPVRSTPQH